MNEVNSSDISQASVTWLHGNVPFLEYSYLGCEMPVIAMQSKSKLVGEGMWSKECRLSLSALLCLILSPVPLPFLLQPPTRNDQSDSRVAGFTWQKLTFAQGWGASLYLASTGYCCLHGQRLLFKTWIRTAGARAVENLFARTSDSV